MVLPSAITEGAKYPVQTFDINGGSYADISLDVIRKLCRGSFSGVCLALPRCWWGVNRIGRGLNLSDRWITCNIEPNYFCLVESRLH